MSGFRAILVGVVVACLHAPVSATNVKFMPGDAFFPSRLTKDVVEKLKNSANEFLLRHEPPTSGGALCGYSGYSSIQITDVPKSWPDQMKEVYTALRYSFPRNITEIYDEAGEIDYVDEANGFWILVYNKNFDFNRYRVGLRYNERWFDPPAREKTVFNVLDYFRPYVPSATGVAEDCRNAVRVEGLQVKYPDLGERQAEAAGELIETPVTVSAKDVRILLIPEQNLELYFGMRKLEFDDRRCNFVVFDNDGVWQFYLNSKGSWESVPWKREFETKRIPFPNNVKDDEIDTDEAGNDW